MTTYIVKNGDSLSLIAQNVLHDITRWPEIAKLNNISNADVIYPGQSLTLPDPKATLTNKPLAFLMVAGSVLLAGTVVFLLISDDKAKKKKQLS